MGSPRTENLLEGPSMHVRARVTYTLARAFFSFLFPSSASKRNTKEEPCQASRKLELDRTFKS